MKITKNTKAIIVVHLFGLMTDMNPFIQVAKKYNLAVVEDAAQSIGAKYNEQNIGSMSDAACLSFFPSKNLGGYGDGGMIITKSSELAQKLLLLRNHGFPIGKKYDSYLLGGNFRLDAIQAAILRVKLKYLENWIEKRRLNAEVYKLRFQKLGFDIHPNPDLSKKLKGENFRMGVTDYSMLPVRHVYNQFVVRASKRNDLAMHLTNKNIGSAVYYPYPLHMQKSLAYLGYSEGDFPYSEDASEHALALPIYPELTQTQIHYVCEEIAAFYDAL
jgi:dTDP-4-amino-4,6-dideoxygalactose transaminase